MKSLMCSSKKMVFVSVRKAMQALGVSLALLLICLPAFSQLNLGRIFGSITDQSGGVIAGATVTVVDVARGISRSLTTESAGEFSAPSLVPSTYTVRAEAAGFKTIERQNVILQVGHDVRIDLTLQPGDQSQTVTVTETLPIINTTDAVISTTLETLSLNELPLSGRLYTKLLDFAPGLSGRPGGNSPTYSSNGAGIFSQDWMLDGVEDTNAFAASGPLVGAATSQDELTVLPLDSIQEVNVMANPKAEFGWQQGAVVNVGLKSGTNNLHGTAYLFARNTALDAKNPFLNIPPALAKADDRFQQFGSSTGGPIKKDKLFFFGNYEGMRYTVGAPNFVSIPSSVTLGTDATNSLPDAIKDLTAHGVPLSQLSLNLAGCTSAGVCDATKGLFTNGSSSNTVPRSLDNTGSSNNAVVKIDYHLNDHNSLNGEYFIGNANTNSAGNGVQPYWVNGNHNRVQAVRAVWVWTPNSNWVNEARFGYDRYNLVDYNAECSQKLGQPKYDTSFGFVSGTNPPFPECGFPIITIAGFTDLGAGEFIADQLVFQKTYHFIDSVSYTRGKHLVKFGGEFHHTLYNGYGAPSCLIGCIQFSGGVAFPAPSPVLPASSGLEDFLAGTPGSGQVLVGAVATKAGFNRYAGFVQDDWRLTPKLTVNLGLRYEFEPPVLESNNAFGNFEPTAPSGMVQQTSGHALYNPDYRNFGPRVGFAWDVTGKGTTVIRAGGSVAYDTIPLDDLLTFQGANLPAVPTGYALFDAAGKQVASPGNIKTGIASLQGGQINWVCNSTSAACPGANPSNDKPVFNTGTSALACGNGLVTVVVNGVPTTPTPCGLQVKPTHAPRSRMTTWNVALQHAFTNNLSLNIAYVGNRATGLPNYININQPTLGTNDAGREETSQPFYNKFPWFGQILQYAPVGKSNYNALQVTLIQRKSHGLSLLADYTFAHALNTQSGDNFAFVQDSTNPNGWYANSEVTPRQHFAVTVTYEIPGKKSPAQLLEGWEINSTVNLISAAYFNATDPFHDFPGVGNGTGLLIAPFIGSNWSLYGPAKDFKNLGRTTPPPCFGFVGSSFANAGCSTTVPAACTAAAASEPTNPNVPSSDLNATGMKALQTFGCYAEGNAAIVPPAQGTFGNMVRNALLGAPFREWDMSVTKNLKFTERLSAQLRAEFYDVTNHRNYNPPGFPFANNPSFPATFGTATQVPNSGNAVNGTGSPRQIQLGLKLIF